MSSIPSSERSPVAIAMGTAVLVATLGFFVWKTSSQPVSTVSSAPPIISGESTPLVHTTPGIESWYTNDQFHFSFRLPDGFLAPEAKSVNVEGAQAVIVHNSSDDELFVLVLPFHNKVGDMVTAEDIRANSVGEHITNVQLGTIAGSLPGLSFATDSTQWGGDGVAFWFIHGNYLFELSTFRKDEPLLNYIRKTWQFAPPTPPPPPGTGLTL